MLSLDDTLRPALDERRAQGLYRRRATLGSAQQPQQLREGRPLVAFCSNDYLGLANHPEVKAAAAAALATYGAGSGASHLVNGHSQLHQRLEVALAEFLGRPRALLFSTGYMANLGVIQALLGRGDEVFEDRLNHASLIDGGLLSRATFSRFKHNDVAHLDSLLARSTAGRKLVVVDGVFSMDGDVAELPALAACARRHGAWLMVDDAHGLGCFGPGGRGSAAHFSLGEAEVPILMGTLGKALGSFGAFVAGSETLIETLIQFARPYIYTTALPPAVAAATLASLDLLQRDGALLDQLQANIAYFKRGCAARGIALLPSDSAVQPLVVGSVEAVLQVSERLLELGYWVTAIRPPTVPQGSARLRITLSASHRQAQIDGLLRALSEVLHDRP